MAGAEPGTPAGWIVLLPDVAASMGVVIREHEDGILVSGQYEERHAFLGEG